MPTLQAPGTARKHRKRRQGSATPAVPAERVREMLLEIAFVLHATRVVGRVGQFQATPARYLKATDFSRSSSALMSLPS